MLLLCEFTYMGIVIDFSVDDHVKTLSLSLFMYKFINGPLLTLNTLTNMHKYPKQNPS